MTRNTNKESHNENKADTHKTEMEKDHRPYPKAAKGPMTEGLLKKLTRAPQLYWRMFILAGAGKHTKKKRKRKRKGKTKKSNHSQTVPIFSCF